MYGSGNGNPAVESQWVVGSLRFFLIEAELGEERQV